MKKACSILFSTIVFLLFVQFDNTAAVLLDQQDLSQRTDTSSFLNGLTTEIIDYDPYKVELSWEASPDTGTNFLHYTVKRNGQTIATTNQQTFIDQHPVTYGTNCYLVCAVYFSGGPLCTYESCVEITQPDIVLNQSLVPADIFPQQQKRVRSLVVRNDGEDGSMLSFEADVDTSAGFIKGITPNVGLLPDWGGRYLDIICDATGYASGTYTQDFQILSNDPDEPSLTVTCQMNVVEPGFISGNVMDFITTDPLPYVSVTAGSFTTETDSAGNYTLDVLPGTYDVAFDRIGYQRDTIHDQNILTADTSIVDILFHNEHYPALFTVAHVSEDESECLVKMGPPGGPYLSAFDDGTAEDLLASDSITYTYAVKFSLDSLSTITGAGIFVDDGLFPPGSRFLGSHIMFYLFDDDGPGGTPGSILDSSMNDIHGYDWNYLPCLHYRPGEGDFYLGIKTLGNWPDIAPVGIDENGPHAGGSYRRTPDGNWEEVTNGNLMIRPIIDGTMNYPYPLEAVLGRHSNFDPFDPSGHGNMTVLDTFPGTNYEYVDTAFHSLEQGYYKYSHAYIYPDGQASYKSISNIVGREMRYNIIFNITTSDGNSPDGAILRLVERGQNWPGDEYYEIVPSNGILELTNVWCGEYELKIFKNGYYTYMESELYLCDTTELDVVLQEGLWPASNLWVDPLTSVATWDPPNTGHLLDEDFENELFPPQGWSSETEGEGWFRTDDGSSANWSIPAGDGFYACVNDDAPGSTNDACCDYLISPPLDLQLYDDYMLVFDTYFDAVNECSAYIVYSRDGSYWRSIDSIADTTAWQQKLVDLSAWSGPNAYVENFWIGFHFDDNGNHSSGWAIDNVKVLSASMRGSDEVLAYQVDLDGQYKGSTTDTTWTYRDLVYGQTYTAEVTAQYAYGNGEQISETFVSEYLAPPDSLQAEVYQDTIQLSWFPPDSILPDHLMGYNIYRNAWGEEDDSLVFIDDPNTLQYIDTSAGPGNHQYVITAIYDLETYGYPGEVGESMIEGPVEVSMQITLPFTQNWDSGALGDWTSSSNWYLNNSSGNPAPAVEFNAGKRLQNYEDSLLSPLIYASQYENSLMYLAFDLKLDNINATGTEKLVVRLYVNDSVYDVWQTKNKAGLNWVNYDIDITEKALGKDFRIGFVATGEDASNISNWGIDNIVVDVICPAPFNVYAEYIDNQTTNARITWQSPDTLGPDAEWLHYDNDENFVGIGMYEAGDFDAPIRFEASHVNQYAGSFLTKIRFYPLVEECEYSLRVWKGENAASLVHHQPVSNPEIGAWNTVELNPPVLIEEEQELWFGYHINSQGGLPAGVDAGPAVTGYGDMIYDDDIGWTRLALDHGLNYNWNIQGFISSALDMSFEKGISGKEAEQHKNGQKRSFIGYNIFYQKNFENLVKLNDAPITENTYMHQVSSIYDYNCYYVEAVFEFCTSSLSEEECLPVFLNNNDFEKPQDGIVKIYPNPASDEVNIISHEKMEGVAIFDFTGQKLMYKSEETKEMVVSTQSLETGVYILRIETTSGIVSRKLTILR